MNKTEADLKFAITTMKSIEQHLDVTRKAIAHDACCKDDSYFHVFNGMISDLRECRERLDSIMSSSHMLVIKIWAIKTDN